MTGIDCRFFCMKGITETLFSQSIVDFSKMGCNQILQPYKEAEVWNL
jgi:hypothetical protein